MFLFLLIICLNLTNLLCVYSENFEKKELLVLFLVLGMLSFAENAALVAFDVLKFYISANGLRSAVQHRLAFVDTLWLNAVRL